MHASCGLDATTVKAKHMRDESFESPALTELGLYQFSVDALSSLNAVAKIKLN